MLTAIALGEVVFNRPLAGGDYRHLAVAVPPALLDAAPGQFFHLLCPGQGAGTHLLRRPLSLFRRDRARQRVEFLYKLVGIGTRALAQLAPGDRLDLLGPLGRGFRIDPGWRHVLLLARGAGLATLAPLGEQAIERGMSVTVVASAARRDLAVGIEHLRALGADVHVVTDADDSSAPEHVEELLRRIVQRRPGDLIATCGSARLLRVAQRLGRELGIAGQVALEEHMACGIGMCLCCVQPVRAAGRVELRRVCADGPVFDVQEALA